MKKIGIICKTGIPEPIEILKELLPWIRQKGYEAFVDNETASVLNMRVPAFTDTCLCGCHCRAGRRRYNAERCKTQWRRDSYTRCKYRRAEFLTAVPRRTNSMMFSGRYSQEECPVEEERIMLTACVSGTECIAGVPGR
jgi:hypothetical protein